MLVPEIPLRRIALTLLPCAFLALACEPQAAPRTPGEMPTTGKVLAKVGTGAVTQEMMDATLARIPDAQREQMEQAGQMDQVKESLFIGELLYQEALKAGLDKDPQVQVAAALAERSALAEAYIEKKVDEGITDARIQQWYDDHKVQFAQEQAKLRIMVLPDEATATEVKTALDGGGDFAALAKEKSEDTKTKDEGGDLGWVEKKGLPPDFSTPIFAAEKGTVVGPIAAGPRQLIFKVEDKRAAVPLDEVKDQIKESLKSEIAQELITGMRDQAKAAMGGGASVSVPAPGAAPAGGAPAGGAPAADPHNH